MSWTMNKLILTVIYAIEKQWLSTKYTSIYLSRHNVQFWKTDALVGPISWILIELTSYLACIYLVGIQIALFCVWPLNDLWVTLTLKNSLKICHIDFKGLKWMFHRRIYVFLLIDTIFHMANSKSWKKRNVLSIIQPTSQILAKSYILPYI